MLGCGCLPNVSTTRSYAALRAADLDWIVGPGEGGQGRNKQKRDSLTRGHNWPFRCLNKVAFEKVSTQAANI